MRILIGWFFIGVLAAQAPDSKQALSMQRINWAAISPDGSAVAYSMSRTNWEDNSNESDLYLADIAKGTTLRLTAPRKSSSSPTWSADGKRIAFLSNRDGKQQIYVMPVSGGEAYAISDHEDGVSSFEWDGKDRIVYTATDSESAAQKDRKKKYGELSIIDDDYVMTHLWMLKSSEQPKQKGERITEGNFQVADFAISPDGKTLAITTKRNPDISTMGAKIEIVDIETKQRRVLAETKNQFGGLKFSPDSKELAYTTPGEVDNAYYANSYIEARPVAGGTARKLSGDVDEQPMPVEWTPRGLIFLARNKTEVRAYVAAANGSGVRALETEAGWNWGTVSLSRDFTKAAFVGARRSEAMELYVTPAHSWSPKALTNMKKQWEGFSQGVREVISWKSQDGATIEGVLIKPRDFDPKRKYPLLVVVHGGPTGIDVPVVMPDSYYPVEQFVAKGALVLRPNYRGSAGYGAKFRALNVSNLGVGDAWDVLSGIDHLVAQGYVDPARVGSMGWSQGGYISAFLATAHASRFKALSVGAGISNWVTYYVNTDIHPFTRQYLKATPWDDMEIYRKTSPMTYIKQAKSPVLIQHGDNDKRVPPPNAFELYQGLKDVGVPAKLVLYKGFGHGITKPKEAMHVLDENLAWFSKYVLD